MPKNFELEVWRTIAMTPDIVDSFAVIGPRVLAMTGATHVLVRHFDLEHQKIETIAYAGEGGGDPHVHAPAERATSTEAGRRLHAADHRAGQDRAAAGETGRRSHSADHRAAQADRAAVAETGRRSHSSDHRAAQAERAAVAETGRRSHSPDHRAAQADRDAVAETGRRSHSADHRAAPADRAAVAATGRRSHSSDHRASQAERAAVTEAGWRSHSPDDRAEQNDRADAAEHGRRTHRDHRAGPADRGAPAEPGRRSHSSDHRAGTGERAAGGDGDRIHSADHRPGQTGFTVVPEEMLGDLIAWSRTGDPIRVARRTDHPLARMLLPKEYRGAMVAWPLSRGPDSPAGALVLAGGPQLLGDAAQATLRLVIEAIAVALENDRRLQRLVRSTEAHEADKRALLSRLDRQDISDSVVGAETGLRDVTEKVHQVAPTDAPVLILGETGAGKEVVARTIHNNSKRASGPMVRVNCGAIPPELIDSELFGHEQGSFTGAMQRRKGWFERADGGTLFLDEIGELPPAAQIRLLRVLQDGVIDRVGAQKSINVDVRIVAATHRDLEEMVRAGSFRQDLWYRIGVFPIRLPPLRERVEDIPALAAHFARRAAKRLGAMPLALTPEDISMLVSYTWPGNVRELAAVIERAAILGGGTRLEIGAALGSAATAGPRRSVPFPGYGSPAGAPFHDPSSPPYPAPPQPSGQAARGLPEHDPQSSLDAAMKHHIEAALTASRGRIDGPFGAAIALRINPHTLRARMRKLGIDWRTFRS